LAVFVSWLRTDERAAKRNDRVGEAAAAAQLAHWRATREAAARAAGSAGPVGATVRTRTARSSVRASGPAITSTAGPTKPDDPARNGGPIPAGPPANPTSS